MKKIRYRAAALVSAGLLLLAGGAMPRVALAEQHFVFYDDFERETVGAMPSQWQIAPGKRVTAETVTEDGNQFMRITAQESGDLPKNRPTVQTKSGLVSAPLKNETKKLVVEAKMRTQNSSMRKSLRLGYTDNDWDANQYNLIAFRNPGGNFTYLNGGVFDGSDVQTVMTWLEGFTNDPMCWYDVQAVIDPTTKVIDYTLVKSGTTETYTATGKMDSPEYNALKVITDLNFRFVTAQVGESMDVDNVKLYYIYPAPTASLLADDGKLPANAQKIGVRFSQCMDKETLTAETVRLEGAGGTEVSCTRRSYDEETCTYYLTPDADLTVGESYRLVLGDAIYAANGAGDYEAGKLIGEHEFTFVVTPAKSTNAALSRLLVNGVSLPNFTSDVFEYTVSMDYAEDLPMPVVQAEPEDARAHASVSYPSEVGDTITVTVTAEDGITQQVYLVHIHLVGEEYAKLGKNLLTNEGFEAGSLAGYSTSSALWNGFSLTRDVARSGNYAALCTNRTDATWHYLQKVTAEANKTYLIGGWVRLRYKEDAGNSFEMYPAGSVTRPFRDEEKVIVSADQWQQVVLTAETNSSVQISPTVQCWAANVDYYVDDLFVGELKPVLKYTGAETIAVQADTKQTVPLSAELVNQLGTKHGLRYSSVRGWELLSAPYGVSLTENNELQIEKDAEAGTIVLEVCADLHYTGATTDVLKKQVVITLTDNGSTAPKAKNVRVSGTVQEGAELQVTYRYYQSEGKPAGEPDIIWLASREAETGYQPIPNATGASYIVDAAHAEQYIRAQVTPKTQEGEAGRPTLSENYVCKAAAPCAQKVTVSVPTACGIGDVLTGNYIYFDPNGDAEDVGKTRIQWLRCNTKDGTYVPIPNATNASYTLTDEDTECYLVFEVTPASSAEPAWGETIRSEAVYGPMPPSAKNVTIEKISSKLLSASYLYEHPHNVAEGETQFRWYIGSQLVGKERSCMFSSLDGTTVRLEVTPAAVKAPYNGKTVATEASFSGRSQSYGGSSRGSGGGGGGSSFTGYVPLPEPKAESKPDDDTSAQPTHWAQGAINWAKEAGYMQNNEEQTPDVQVSRQQFLTYVLRCVGLQPTTYTNLFGDVSAEDDFGGILQTAVDQGIISRDELFYPQRSVTREEICKIVVTALKASGCTVTSGDVSSFADADVMAAWARDYIKDMVGTGIMQGVGDGQFMPRGTVTVGQTAAILQRLSNYCEQAKAVAAQ